MKEQTKALLILILDKKLSEDDKCRQIADLFAAAKEGAPAKEKPEINYMAPVITITPPTPLHSKLNHNTMISPACLAFFKKEYKVLAELVKHGADIHLPLSLVAFSLSDPQLTHDLLLDPNWHFDVQGRFHNMDSMAQRVEKHLSQNLAITPSFKAIYVKVQLQKIIKILKGVRDGHIQNQYLSAIETFHLAMTQDSVFLLKHLCSRVIRVNQYNKGAEEWYLHDFLTLLKPYIDLPGERIEGFNKAFMDLVTELEKYDPETQGDCIKIFETHGDRDQFVYKYLPTNNEREMKESKDEEITHKREKSKDLSLVATLKNNSSPLHRPETPPPTNPTSKSNDDVGDDYEVVDPPLVLVSEKGKKLTG